MAELELIEERLISGKGLLRVPADKKKNRLAILYLDVVRKPTNPYLNKNYNPARGRYATVTFVRNDYVLSDAPMEYERQVFDGVNDICGQSLIAIKCMYVGVLQTFINLGLALGLPPISVTNTIDEYENLRLAWDECRIVCYGDTAVQCRLYRLKYDVCDEEFDDDFSPPPPPPPRDSVPPGTPIDDISPPYDGDDDDGNTDPADGDELYEPPLAPNACQRYRIAYSYDIVNGLGQPAGRRTTNVETWGIITEVSAVKPFLRATSQGATSSACSTLQQRNLFTDNAMAPTPNLSFTITPV